MDVGDANDHRIGNVYESIAGVWFLQRDYGRILDLRCLIIDIQTRVLDSHPMPERFRGSEGLVRGPPSRGAARVQGVLPHCRPRLRATEGARCQGR